MTLAGVLALSLLVGVALGALGGGGSILTVPILVYVAGLEPKQAIATSLLVVAATSVAGAVTHARAGRIRWRTGVLFGAGGMVGAFGGGILGGYVPGRLLLIGFALMMVATSIAMLRARRTEPAHARGDVAVVRALIDGVVVGLVTGLVGAGGGFLVVPALALLGGLPMAAAVGTSLIVIAMKSFAGLAGYLTSVSIAWDLAIGVTAAAILGSVLGGWLAGRIPEARLRSVFGWFVLVMGAFVLLEQAAPPGGLLPGMVILAAVGLVAGAWHVWTVRARSTSVS
ncbi:sulfite exporter TauE/SafE family protein [Nonomuraea sp. NPDC050478]|uniref:sulfite exporter TauE/SafE family protein n=1 Tax=Nonomuraea sp. NPDC050478 TaxID=3364365 RepID=UPI0037BCC643